MNYWPKSQKSHVSYTLPKCIEEGKYAYLPGINIIIIALKLNKTPNIVLNAPYTVTFCGPRRLL